jgi:hypothetical protein
VKKESSLTWKTLLITALACAALIGCGGDDEDGSNAGAGGSGGSDNEDGGSGNGGSGGSSGGSGGNSGGSGGMGGSGGGLPMLTCSEELPTSPITCGGTECPMPMAPPIPGLDLCARPCCTADDACGTFNAVENMETECMAAAQPDPRCMDHEIMGMTLEGCCIDNKCGIISALRGNACITESMFIELPQPPPACGDETGDDAGAP